MQQRLRENGAGKDARETGANDKEIWLKNNDSEMNSAPLVGSGIDPVLELCALLNLGNTANTLRNEEIGVVAVHEVFKASAVKALMEIFEMIAADSSLTYALQQFIGAFRVAPCFEEIWNARRRLR